MTMGNVASTTSLRHSDLCNDMNSTTRWNSRKRSSPRAIQPQQGLDDAHALGTAGAKSLKRYGKLMGRRIDWAAVDEDEEAAARAPGETPRPPNACTLVWEGSVAKPAFQKFSVEVRPVAASSSRLLKHKICMHMPRLRSRLHGHATFRTARDAAI